MPFERDEVLLLLATSLAAGCAVWLEIDIAFALMG